MAKKVGGKIMINVLTWSITILVSTVCIAASIVVIGLTIEAFYEWFRRLSR